MGFETDYCTWANNIETYCNRYDGCYDAENAQYETTKTEVTTLVAQFKLQQQALEHLICYADEILKNATIENLDECDNLVCQRCSNYDIVPENPHTKITCSESKGDDKPCSDG